MPLIEINFDGIVGPTHNYSGLSLGNLAATHNAGAASRPRAAALQGIAKMRGNVARGLAQGVFMPHRRPAADWLATLGTTPDGADAVLLANAMSASPMWAANAATVSPSPDTADGRCHLTVANLMTMPHRSHEWRETLAQLRLAFADTRAFAIHGPVPPPFGDEGAANHMRLTADPGAPGVEVFVYGTGGGPFPARQSRMAGEAVARRHGLDPSRTLFVAQSEAAIAAGAFHNDVVAVADGRVLFAHEQAFADRAGFYADLRRLMPGVEIVEVPADRVSLADAIRSYLFNAQLVTLPSGESGLVLPGDAREVPSVRGWLEAMVAGNGPIRRLDYVDVRESMANGGGPACLRLRVMADPATIDPRFLADDATLARIAGVVEAHWPETIDPAAIGDPALWRQAESARAALLDELGLGAAL
ncbi:N-succinylarginine dihydrolase [Sphingomonas solaris]|uniref:N-succinylarginine dihydrolase n=1 Tax=Alterirhizorhabdus solaris TaxID=2529389 RepID=A0A558QVB0_9SPHN|nr:N-succinylarginine dihydrolase [Sphingomonas solaris]TVV71002.1 N-succinylarginine dihydrolase [Sphingomonas solaris]